MKNFERIRKSCSLLCFQCGEHCCPKMHKDVSRHDIGEHTTSCKTDRTSVGTKKNKSE